MADSTDVKQLLLQVDATTELLRRNLSQADAAVANFTASSNRQMDIAERGFSNLGRGLDNLAAPIARANAQIGTIGVSVVRAQKQIEASSSVIKASLAGAASSLAVAFSADKIRDYADGYTRFTNQLKVAGLEGSNLATVQTSLFNIAQKYGAPLEQIGTLYGRASQAGKSLGASQNDLLRFSGAVAAALKVQGGSAEEASGALLQLSQALGSGTVHAEEFNSVNEGLRPLLAAAADASDKYRGNIALLKNDVNSQKLSSQELFQLILKGYDELQAKASRAGFTIGASFTILNNAIGQYIGGTDSSLSATERFSQAIQLLANNLDTVAPAIETIAISFGVLKAGGMALNAIASGLATVAQADQATARAVLLGNAQFIDRTALAAKSAIAAKEAAAAEVAAIEETIVARRADKAAMEENLAVINRQRADALQAQGAIRQSYGLGFGTLGQGRGVEDAARANQDLKTQIATKRAIAAADAELLSAETALAAAQERNAAATVAASAATAAATFGARAAAAATALLTGALDLLAGALPIIAIGAVVAAIMHLRSEISSAEQQTKAFADRHKDAADVLKQTSVYGASAASAISHVGSTAAAATGQMASFAGQVGEAADQLLRLAHNRRADALEAQRQAAFGAANTIAQAQANIQHRELGDTAPAAYQNVTGQKDKLDGQDRAAIAQAQKDYAAARAEYGRLSALKPDAFVSQSEANGGRDVTGDLERSRRDLKVAQAGGDKGEILRLQAQVYQLTQYQKYRKDGASDESASSRSNADAEAFRNAGQARLDHQASTQAGRETAAAGRRQAALVTDAANDERAYRAAERAAQDKIAQSNADLTNSAAARAQIERDRVRADQTSKDNELADQAKAGHLGDAKTTPARLAHLQGLNKDSADAQIEVIDLHERQQKEADAAAIAERGLSAQRDLLSDQEQLATSSAQRRAIELELLDLAKKEEKVRLERVLAFDSGASEGDRAQALVDYNTLDARYGAKQAVTLTQTEGAGQKYARDLNGQNVGEQFDQVKVDGLNSLENGLTGIVTGTKSVKSAFKDMASSIIADLARIAIEQAIIKPLANSLFGGASAAGGGAGGILSIFGKLFGGKRALGGGVQAGKVYWVGENGPEPFIPGADGSIVPNHAIRQPGAPTFQPAAPSMAAIGAAQRAAAMPPIEIAVRRGEMFEPYVHGAAAQHARVAESNATEAGANLASDRASWSRGRQLGGSR